MPRFDQTGPNGMGPMTGRMAGNCRRSAGRQNENFYGGVGLGRRGGAGGRGFNHWFRAIGLPGWMRGRRQDAMTAPEMTPEQEKQMLQNQAEVLQQQLDRIRQRITTISDTPAK